MKIEREGDEILIRISTNAKASKIQSILKYLRYEELTFNSEATEVDLQNLLRDAKKGRFERFKDETGFIV